MNPTLPLLLVLQLLTAADSGSGVEVPSDAAKPTFDWSVEPEQPDVGLLLGEASLYGGAQFALQYAVLYTSKPANWYGYGNSPEPQWNKFHSNFGRAPVFEPDAFGGGGVIGLMQADGDPWLGNVVGHGLQGSEIYLRMRQKGFEWWSAALMGVAHSTFWEYGVEGWHETPSGWDLVYTPIGGALIGELRYRLYSAYGDRWYVRALADPVGELVASLQ